MISLKKHIDTYGNETLAAALEGYREALLAIGKSGEQAVPGPGGEMKRKLAALAETLSTGSSHPVIGEASGQIASEIRQWGDAAAQHNKDRTREFKEIVTMVARTGEAVGERDQRYATQLNQFTAGLQDIAHLEDLATMRRSIVSNARELTACVARMSEEGEKAISALQAEVAVYRTRLEDAERRASMDLLTGLPNRGAVERGLRERMEKGGAFSVIVLDLNGFKTINDSCGHIAGDDLLKQFARELKGQFRPSDLVGRWGGDEFVGILDVRLDQAVAYYERLERWVFGEYKIHDGKRVHKVKVSAAAGFAQWDGSENATALINRADTGMYHKKPKGGSPRTGSAGTRQGAGGA